MSAHVLLNLLNKFNFLFNLFNTFNKVNNTGVRMLESIYHMTLKILKNRFFGVKTSRFPFFYATL